MKYPLALSYIFVGAVDAVDAVGAVDTIDTIDTIVSRILNTEY